MSSEGSKSTSSSRLSQFGIYRSIDARTEEFLRLSRKRQIRQGCACAAVSTAITVTIVITVLLVYEYTMNLDSNPTLKTRMAAWHSIFNDTSPFEVKYNKAKINIDPTTLKLLPLVLKALNQNRYLEKFIENSNLETTTEEKKDISFDNNFIKNLFHGTKVKPTQSVHTTDFKTHTVGYKNTFNHLDYYKKIRKENDNNRMLYYFEKMTNVNNIDSSASNNFKVTYSPIQFDETIQKTYDSLMVTQPTHTLSLLKKKERITNKKVPKNTTNKFKNAKKQKYTTKFTTSQPSYPYSRLSLEELVNKINKTNSLNRNQRVSLKTSTDSCNCSKKLTKLLSKLLTDIQNILPEIESYRKWCVKVHKEDIENSKSSTTTLIPIYIKSTSEKTFKKSKFKFLHNNIYSTKKPKFNFKNKESNKSAFNKTIKNDSIKLPFNFNLLPHISFTNNIIKRNITTTIKTFIEPTYTTEAFEGVSTEPMNEMISKHIWKHVLNENPIAPNKYSTITRKTNAMSNNSNDTGNNTNFFNVEYPHFLKGDLHVSNESEDFLIHSRDNLYIFPLLRLPGEQSLKSQSQKQKTTSLIEWIKILKDEKRNNHQYKLNLKGENKLNLKGENKLNLKGESRPLSNIMQKTAIKPKMSLDKHENKKEIEPKINKNLNVLNDLNTYQEKKNITLKRKNINTTWPNEEKNNQLIPNETVIPIKIIQNVQKHFDDSVLPVVNNLKQKTNETEFDEYREKTKRKCRIQRQNATFNNSHEFERKKEITMNSVDKLHVTNTTSFQINQTDLFQSPSQIFFSKFAEINDLLYQTKNISKTTIYEKFNFGHNFNHTDDNNTLATLEYDEFKFLNDELLEKESPEVRFSEIDKYQTVKRKYENSEDSAKFIKSMLPISRPVFLEIQRNDWKHDQDYGNNDNNFE